MPPSFNFKTSPSATAPKPRSINVSLDVPAGVVCALLGENGAGKTTAIRILLGLTEPDAGTATVLGLNSTKQGQAVRAASATWPSVPRCTNG